MFKYGMRGLWNIPAQKPFMISCYLPTKLILILAWHIGWVLNNWSLVTFPLFQHAYVYATLEPKCTHRVPPLMLCSHPPSYSYLVIISLLEISPSKAHFLKKAWAIHAEKQSLSLKLLPCSCLKRRVKTIDLAHHHLESKASSTNH